MAAQSKIHPNLAGRMQVVTAGLAPEYVRVIVRYRIDPLQIIAGLLGLSATYYTFRLLYAAAHSMTREGIIALSQRADVQMIWYDEPVHTLLDVSVPLIGTPLVWQAGVAGKGIRVGVVDTGIDPDHSDFAGRIVQMKDFTGQGPNDNNGHGTHVAGIVGGTGSASGGKYRGVAPECLYYTAKVLRGDGSGNTSDVMAGVEWAVQQGVQVVNLSLGSDGSCDGTDALSVTCDAAMGKGVVVCVAAGNAGPGASTVGSPGCAKTVITIGATTKSDQVADFSSRGPTSDDRIKPDVCFPGGSIISCRAKGTSMGTAINDSYTQASGTSMATPHAAGACALLLQAKPGLAPQQIKNILMNTAKYLNLDANIQGTGRAQLDKAYEQAISAQPTPAPSPMPDPTPLPTPTPAPTPAGDGCLGLIKSLLGGR